MTAPENTPKTGGNRGRFQPGQSGNPGGRPKRTPEERDALAEIRTLSAEVPGKLRALLRDKKTPPAIRLRVCEIILDRTYGKPTERIDIREPDFSALDAAFDAMRASLEEDGSEIM